MQTDLSDFLDESVNRSFKYLANNYNQMGTFAESMKRPIHRWFRYPAGYSASLTDYCAKMVRDEQSLVYDPFVGSGTTSVSCKLHGIDSVGIEAHPLIARIANVKVFWEYDMPSLRNTIEKVIHDYSKAVQSSLNEADTSNLPNLLHKCFTPSQLREVITLRNLIYSVMDDRVRELLVVALLATAREVSHAGTGWPYILPKRRKNRVLPTLGTFKARTRMMMDDLYSARSELSRAVSTKICQGDSRRINSGLIDTESVHLAVTSPPYLNNYDYADRTRFELYLLGEATTWGDITRGIRDILSVSATTQIRRSEYNMDRLVREELPDDLRSDIEDKVKSLGKERSTHSGRKSYDIMVAQYFNDMYESILETYRVLLEEKPFVLVLGDSAPYGVYVPTHEYMARIAQDIGFRQLEIHKLRERGDKWKSAPKHRVPLGEYMVVLWK